MSASSQPIQAEFPEKLQFLFQPARFKVLWGGRGGAKSWGIARALLLLGAQRPLRIVCAREIQKSIAESVHALLKDQIIALGLGDVYTVTDKAIRAANGTQFSFHGLKHNVENIKSLEGCDIVWVEEAQSVSNKSWETLIPTIRAERSEIWASFNPDLETDDTYTRFVVNPPPDAIVVKVGWRDNPWFPEVLRKAKNHLLAVDPDKHAHVWEGNCISVLAGSIYANELRLAEQQDRLTRVPYNPALPVDCFWDLGTGDLTAIWFVQRGPFEYRLIDYLEGSGQKLQWYLREMQAKGYVYGVDWLPWDLGAQAQSMGSGQSVEKLMRDAGRSVRISPRQPVVDRITAARTVFELCWFDRERCADGVQALRHYRYGEHENLETAGRPAPTRKPLHDWASHGSDAFGYFAMNAKPPKRETKTTGRGSYGGGWSG